MALEEYIRQVKETWSTYHLELVNYQNKIRLIRCVKQSLNEPTYLNMFYYAFCRGWDDLFNKCSENLNSLTAMKLSPYYKGDYFVS